MAERYRRAKSSARNEILAAEGRERREGKDSIPARIARLNAYKKEATFLETRCQRILTMLSKAKKLGNKKRVKALEAEYMRSERAFNETGFKREIMAEELKEDLAK